MVGQTVGKYRVVSRLGRGGMGTVYRAVDQTLERDVAIKCLNHDLNDAEVLKRFRAEAITLARLNHPNIATLFELTEHDGELLMVMEFVRGETFESLSRRLGPLPVARAAQLCSQVLDALTHAHLAGVVHRDLKPANLMLTESGLTKVMDFGLARMAGTEHLTNNGFMVGTPAYMAPEQVLGHDIDGRADLYAMGVVLFRLLTAQLPFKADSGIAMVQKQLHDQPTPVRQLRTDLPAVCEEILRRALAKAPHDRFQTADDFRAALAGLVGTAGEAEATPSIALPSPGMDPGSEPTLPATPSPTALGQPPPAVASAPTVVLPAPRRATFAATGAIAAVLIAGISVTTLLVWRARAATPTVTPVSATDASSGLPAAPAPAPAPVAAPVPVPASPAAGARTDNAAAPPAPSAAAGAPGQSVAAALLTRDVPVAASASSATTGASSPHRTALPVVTFAKVKLLMSGEGKSSDRDASLRLGTDGLEILDDEKTLQSTPYSDVIGLYLSHSREPRWATPDGTSVAVAKAGGKFGFLKGAPDWITVRTRRTFIPLRVQENERGRLIAELEARTGTKVIRTR